MSNEQLMAQLTALGIQPGGVLLVHTSFRNIRPIEGGVAGLIAALCTVLGPQGTLVMPSMSSDDAHVFSPTTTDCLDLGIVADTFWRQPGVLRSNNPHAFAARGPAAALITAPHPIDIPHGLASPVGRVYELNGQVLLLGVGHDSNTTIHLAENIAAVPYRQKYHVTILRDEVPTRFEYSEIDHCTEKFELVGTWLEQQGLQVKGPVGQGVAILCQAQDIVRVVLDYLALDKLTFLHPVGTDPECDAARASLANL